MKQHQQGFLLVLAIAMILVMSFIGLILTRLFTNQTNTSTNLMLSKQALYIAVSGLDIAKRDITKKAISCNDLAAQHTAESAYDSNSGVKGQFSVSGSLSNVSTQLSSNINNSSATIQLISASGFSTPAGIVKIDNEYIYYSSISGNVLSGLSRGKAGSVVSSHNSGAAIKQSQCYITSTGAIPTMNAATHKSKVSSIVLINAEMSLGGYQPSVSSGGNVSMSGNAYIANPGITLNEDDYPGSTLGIMSPGSLNISGNANTKVENEAGTGLVESTSRNHILPDVIQNIATPPSLHSSYFGDFTSEQLRAAATSQGHYFASSLSNINLINGVTGGVIYVNGSVNVSGNPSVTIGYPSDPVVLYIDGSFNASGTLNLTVYGIIYVTGTVNLNGNIGISGDGSLAAGNGLNITGSTLIALSLTSDDPVMSSLYSTIIPGAGTITFSTENLGIQQIHY